MNPTLIQKTISLATVSHGAHCYNTHHMGHVFPFQSHDFDLLFTLEGKFHFEIDGTQYVSEPNDIIIIPPYAQFRGEAMVNSYHFFSHFTLLNSANRQLTFHFDDCRLPRRYTLHYEMVRSYFDKFFNNAVYGESYGLVLKLVLIEMILCSERNRLLFSKTNNFELPVPVTQLVDYIEAHYKEELNNEILARIAGVSTATLNNYFSRYMSITPAKYVEKLRMEYAMETLSQHGASIAALAEELQYSDQFAFSKAFKRYCSYTPSEYYQRFNADW